MGTLEKKQFLASKKTTHLFRKLAEPDAKNYQLKVALVLQKK